MKPIPQLLPSEPVDVLLSAEAEMRAASTEARGRMVVRAVRAAAIADRSRREAGLPEPVREPWPASTREFLERHAAAARVGLADARQP
jgi:hypothetical protein